MVAHFQGDLKMIKKIIAPIVLALGLGTGSAYAVGAPATGNAYGAPATGAANPAEMMNPFAWMGKMNSQPNVQHMNLARPEGDSGVRKPMN